MPGDNRTQIIVAALALLGALGTAAFANWDKLSSAEKPNPPAPQPSTSQSVGVGNGNIQISGSNNVVNPPAVPKPCRAKTHGVERYGRDHETTKDSPWMGGGFNPDRWCAQAIDGLRSEHPDCAFKVLGKSEDTKNTCPPFNCPQYRYTCKIEASLDPLYVEKLSSACK